MMQKRFWELNFFYYLAQYSAYKKQNSVEIDLCFLNSTDLSCLHAGITGSSSGLSRRQTAVDRIYFSQKAQIENSPAEKLFHMFYKWASMFQ